VTRSRIFSFAATASFLAAAASCARNTKQAPDASSVDPAGPGAEAPQVERDEIRPVYPVDAGPPDPRATRFCEAVQLLPVTRRANCCAETDPLRMPTDECVRTLTAALGAHAVTLSPSDVDGCAAAMRLATAGCDWVTARESAVPPACTGIIRGTLRAKQRCRSSLECDDGLHCQGLSAVDVGVCGAPKASSLPCHTAIDVLAAYTRQDDLDHEHPECAGYCARSQCKDAVPQGGPCTLDLQCGRSRCESGRCLSEKLPSAGQPCAGACAYGSRCVDGACVTPRSEGQACEADGQCRGACVRPDGGLFGACNKSCWAARIGRR
jgi:hypothetical protein